MSDFCQPTLSAEELFEFALNGFIVRRNAIDPDLVAELRDGLVELEGLDREELPPCAIPVWTPVVDEYKVLNVLECGEPFLRVVDHPSILRWADALVPAPQRLTQAFSITRRRGVGLPLHWLDVAQSSTTDGSPRTQFLTASVALSEVGPDDGPMVAFAGSHRAGVPFPYGLVHPDWDDPGVDGTVTADLLARDAQRTRLAWERIPGYTEIHVRPGDLILWTEDLVHGAKANHSGRVRRSLFYSYSPQHFPNWHGVRYSADLLGTATGRARELLGGPYLGDLYDGSHDAAVVPSELVRRVPTSSRDKERFRATPQERGSDDPALAEVGLASLVERANANRDRLDPARTLRGSCAVRLNSSPPREFAVVLEDRCSAKPEHATWATCRIDLSPAVLRGFVDGSIDPVEAFYGGALRVRGDVRWAMRLADLWTVATPS